MLVFIKVKLKKGVKTGDNLTREETEIYGGRTKREKGETETQAKKAVLRAAAGFAR